MKSNKNKKETNKREEKRNWSAAIFIIRTVLK